MSLMLEGFMPIFSKARFYSILAVRFAADGNLWRVERPMQFHAPGASLVHSSVPVGELQLRRNATKTVDIPNCGRVR